MVCAALVGILVGMVACNSLPQPLRFLSSDTLRVAT
jgi:hypothetical protein